MSSFYYFYAMIVTTTNMGFLTCYMNKRHTDLHCVFYNCFMQNTNHRMSIFAGLLTCFPFVKFGLKISRERLNKKTKRQPSTCLISNKGLGREGMKNTILISNQGNNIFVVILHVLHSPSVRNLPVCLQRLLSVYIWHWY